MVDVRDGSSLLLCWALRDPAWCVLQAGSANAQPHPSDYDPSNTMLLIGGLSSFLWRQCRVSGTCVGH